MNIIGSNMKRRHGFERIFNGKISEGGQDQEYYRERI